MHLLAVLGTLLLLSTVESGFYDYDNEVYDYYRGESSNNIGQNSVSYQCHEEGFHEDPNDCRAFYRCVDYGNGAPLTPFKFECGPGTVFSKARGNVCVRPADSGRQECCEPNNEIDSNGPDYGDSWNQEGQKPQNPGYPPQRPEQPDYPQTQRPQKPSYPSTQRPQNPSYLPPQSQTPTYPPSTSRPSYGPPQTQRPTYPPSTQQPQRPSYGPPQTQRPTYPPSTQQPQRPTYPPSTQLPQKPSSHGPPQTQRPTYPPQTQSPSYPSTQRPQQPTYPSTQGPQQPSYPSTQQPSSGGCTSAPGESGSCGNSPGCTQEGFYPNSEDCHKFYRCVNEDTHLQRHDFTCGSGTAWDQELQTCNHEHEVPSCGGSSGVQPPQGSGYPSSRPPTSQSTLKPGGQYPPSSRPTEPPYPYPPSQQPTHTPYPPSQGTQRPTQPPSYPTQPSYPPSQGTQRPEQPQYPTQRPTYPTQRPTYPTQSPYPPSQGTQRPEQPQYPTQRPTYPTQSPYPPSQGTQRPEQPQYPTQGTQRPTTPQYPIQPPSSTKGPEYVPPTNPSTSRPSYPGGSTEAPGTGGRPCPPTGSSADCKEEGFFPNPQDCHKFFRCVNEGDSLRKYDFECGTGTAWDQQLQTCNFEETVGCRGSGSGGQPPESGISPGGNQPGSGTGPESQQPGTGQLPGSTPGTSRPPTTQSSQSTSRPYPESTQGTILPSTLRPQQSSTEYPQTTREPGYPPTSQPQQPTTQQPTSSQGTQQPPQSRPPSESQSGSSGQKPGGNGQQPSGSGSQHPPSASGACQGEGFFPHPNDCRKFIRCVSNPPSFIKYEFDCGPGTAWDQNLLTCNYIHLVASCDMSQNEIEPNQPSPPDGYPTGSPSGGSTLSPPSSSSGYPSKPPSSTTPGVTQPPLEENKTEPSQQMTTTGQSSAESSTSSESSSTTPSSQSSSSSTESGSAEGKPDCNPPKKNTTIVCEMPGFNPHPTRCDKFYRCVDNGKGFNVYYFDCPPGTIFDPSIDVCNYPESVYPARDCENPQGAQSPPTSQSPSSSTTQNPPSNESSTKQPVVETTTTPSEVTTSISSEATTTVSSEVTTSVNSEATTTEESSTEGPSTTESGTTAGATESSSEVTTPGAEGTTQESEGMTQSSEATTTGSEGTTTNPETTTLSSEGTTTESESTTIGSTPGEETTTTGSSEETTSSAPEEQQSTTSSSQETTTAMTEQQESTTPGSSEKPPSVDNCPTLANLTDEQIVLVCPTGFKRHPKLCNLFYQCTSSGNMEIKILILQCPNGTIFDEKENKCLAEADSNEACMGSIAGKRTRRVAGDPSPVIEVSTKPLCPDEGHFPYRHGCSNVFYKCKRDTRSALQGYLYKCPKDFVYWSVSRRCERASRLPMCTRMSDETEFENEALENRWEIPIEDRNLSARSLIL